MQIFSFPMWQTVITLAWNREELTEEPEFEAKRREAETVQMGKSGVT